MMSVRGIARTVVSAAVLVAVALPVAAQTPMRVPDEVVGQQMEKVQKGLDRFIDGMDRQIRSAVLRGDSGEIDVKVVLEDLKRSVREMRDGYKPPSSSGITQMLTCLKKLKAFDGGLAKRPGLSGADMKWADLVPDLQRVAGAYGFDWNSDPAGWKAWRASDKEVRQAADTLKKSSEKLASEIRNIVNKDKALDAAGKQAANEKVAPLSTAAKSLVDALKNNADASAAVSRVLSAGMDVSSFMAGYAAAAKAQPTWASANGALDTLAKAFGVPR